MQRKTIQYQETMGDHFHKSHAIAVSEQDIMQEIAHPQQQTPTLDNNHYRWDLQ